MHLTADLNNQLAAYLVINVIDVLYEYMQLSGVDQKGKLHRRWRFATATSFHLTAKSHE